MGFMHKVDLHQLDTEIVHKYVPRVLNVTTTQMYTLCGGPHFETVRHPVASQQKLPQVPQNCLLQEKQSGLREICYQQNRADISYLILADFSYLA